MTFAPLPEQTIARAEPVAPRRDPEGSENVGEETFTGVVRVGGLAIRLAGIAVRLGEETVTGSAGSLHDDPLPRARSELAERLTLLRAIRISGPKMAVRDRHRRRVGIVSRTRIFPIDPADVGYRSARSNGVAAGASWDVAARRARLELV